MKQTEKQIEIKKCPICNTENFKFFLNTKDYFLTRKDFTLVQCSNCSFVFTNPRPDAIELPKYYESTDYLSHSAQNRNIKGLIYKIFRTINIKKKYKLIKKYCNGNSILDIGSGTGEFLAFFKSKGWKVVGIEPNNTAREVAKNTHNIEIYDNNKLEKLQKSSFDIITLWHVLEHVPDLNKTINQIKHLLAKNGFIIIAVPNIEAPDFERYQERWAALDVPRHLYHFSKNTLSKLLEKHNFEIIQQRPMPFDAYYVSLLSEKYLQHNFSYIRALINGFSSNKRAKTNNNYSSMIFVAKQK